MKSKSLTLSTGLAMFSMFFGSGNLVFPLVVGQMSEGHYLVAFLGIFLTGVLVPFLGILAMLLFNGNSKNFFAGLGRFAPFWFPLLALSLIGPFGVLARCITVAHGAFRLLVAESPLWMFSVVSCIVIFLLTIRKNKIVPVLGALLTPLLLVCLAAIAVIGLTSAPIAASLTDGSAWEGFKQGIFQGYQTMDLLAAFFFSAFVIKHLQDHKKTQANPTAFLPIFFRASLIGAGLLTLVYAALVLLGAKYAPELSVVPPQEMLGHIAQRALGSWAAPVVCIAVILACITTAVVLASLFADFLRKEISQEKISPAVALITTLAIAFVVSTLEFSGIAKILGPILEVTYPALIVLTVLSIFNKLWGWSALRAPTFMAFAVKLLSRVV